METPTTLIHVNAHPDDVEAILALLKSGAETGNIVHPFYINTDRIV